MTNEDLERLIKVLDGTQFEIENRADGYVWVSLKDPWEGVEFCKSKSSDSIYLVADLKDLDLKKRYIPSTEEAYVNQLKAKALELYGDIKDQDKFLEPNGNTDTYREKGNKSNPEWDYIKNQDELFLYSILLYKGGKWAKKLPKRIEVSILNIIIEDNYQAFEKCKSIGKEAIFDYMSKQLEKLLNDEVD